MKIILNKFRNILEYNPQNIKKQKHISDIKIFYQNIRSLKNKLEEVEILIEKYMPDVVILTETWLTNDKKSFIILKIMTLFTLAENVKEEA